MPKSKYSTGLEGQRFGRWIIISFSHSRGKSADGLEYCWLCRCDCGNERVVNVRLLFRHKSTSCGCYNREAVAKAATKHGLLVGVKCGGKKTPGEYNSWDHMQQRTTNPKHNKSWHRYGGRGISVCAGFQEFSTFFSVMGFQPTPAHSIDRINNDGNYSCGQCDECLEKDWPLNTRWATPREQAANRSVAAATA